MQNIQEFLAWEQMSRDTIDVKKVYIDIAGDLIAGILLSQIIYWHLPNQEGQTKLRVEKNGQLWLVKGREDWWEECRISPKQFDRAITILQKKNLVEKKIFKFNGNPTTHIRLNFDVLIQYLSVFTQRVKTNLPKEEKPNLPNGKNEVDEKVNSLTENTTENTTEINNNIEAASQKPNNDVVKKNNNNVSSKQIQLIKQKIEDLTGQKVIDDVLLNFFRTHSDAKERLEKALNVYNDVVNSITQIKDILNPVGLFFYIANNNVEANSKSIKQKKRVNFNNFEQHEYTEEELERLFESF